MSTRIEVPAAATARAILAWYRPRTGDFPWRRSVTPYRVLVSEVMLQQTQASRVVPAFRDFVRWFPSAAALARASRADVLRAWSGLGYNRRALALHDAARAVHARGGRFPRTVAELRELPGVGPYTASAVASIAFGAPVAAVDVNVRRVVGRLSFGTDTAPAARVAEEAQRLVSRSEPGEWNQGVMDIGREICRARDPQCGLCPVARWCEFFRTGAAPQAPPPRQPRFEGSFRQVRGAVVRVLSQADRSIRFDELVRNTGLSKQRVLEAVCVLAQEGMVSAGPAALAGRPAGRLRIGGEDSLSSGTSASLTSS